MTHAIASDRTHRESMFASLLNMQGAREADEIIRRLVDFAREDGFCRCIVGGVELFATRTTTVRDLERVFSRKQLALRGR